MPTPTPALSMLTDAERAVIGAATAYARRHNLSVLPERAYRSALPGARRRTLRRFVGGLLRDAPAGLAPPVVLSTDKPTLPPDSPAPLSEPSGERLLADIGPLPDGCRTVRALAFPASNAALLAPVAGRHGYDRLGLSGSVYRWTTDGVERLDHPIEVVPLVECEGAFADAEQARLIERELDESTANLAFARLAAQVEAARCADADTSISALAGAIPGADPAASLERIAVEGHPFHPSAKIRRGMTPGSALTYAPEFTPTIHVRFAAVRADYAKRSTTGKEPITDRLFALFDGLEVAVVNALPAGRSRSEYAVVPIHPWQFQHVLPDRYRRQVADRRVVPVTYSHPATPLLNLRTVVPHATDRTGAGPHPHLKLAIDVRTTNAVRTLSPQAVHNGPRVTAALRAIADRSNRTLGFLDEPAATCYHAPGGPHPAGDAFDDARNLSGLVRQSPHDHPLVPGGTVPIVVSSLLARSPATGRPLVADVAERYCESTGGDSEAFFEEYVGTVVPDHLSLLSAYGVALESHAQNSLVAFEEGRPVAALVRDFGGVRVHAERLAARGLTVDTYPDSDVRADGERALHRKLYYALFQNHLAELIVALVRATDIDEERCWTLVRAACERTFDDLRGDPSVPDRWIDRDEAVLFADPAEHKALTAMRLQGKRHEYAISRVSNPLAR